MQVREQAVQVDGHPMHCRIAGNGSEAVLLLHGIPTNSYLWHEVTAYLAPYYTVVAPDLIGYGRSGRAPAEALTLPKQAQYVVQMMDRLGIERAHVVGHDLGGGIAQILAVFYPDRVSSIAIVDGVAFSNWPLPEVVAMRHPTAPEFEPGPAVIERMLRIGTFKQKELLPHWIQAFTAPFFHETGPRSFKPRPWALEHDQTEALAEDLTRLHIPALILWGQYDRFLPAYWGQRLQQTIPGSVFRLLPECGHYCMIDNPSLVAAELLQHLQGQRMMNTPASAGMM